MKQVVFSQDRAWGQAVTLYGVAPTTTEALDPSRFAIISQGVSITISPVSTREDGRTVYEEAVVYTKEVVGNSFSQTTLTSDFPQTGTYTFVAGATDLVETFSLQKGPEVFVHSCSFEGTGGVCVFGDVVGSGTGARTSVTSVTGVPTPFYTITRSSAAQSRWHTQSLLLSGAMVLAGSLITLKMALGI
ncbi:hypothetical protein D9756_010869 [Leucocoprinus leucothites]|uniref:Uncharacterized protein n=1 Tax=Leucocoprinus leucothites TaxID=201217 RepID=A0A8H5FQV9_9AGAR|nr:hypothetical protein D9756_010869 [Leucoagaricus leucothites]